MAAFWGRDERRCTGRCCRVWCLIAGAVIALVFGLLLVFGTAPFVRSEIKKTLEVYNGSAVYKSWVLPTEAAYTSYYVFNLTNYEDVLDGAKPNVEEFGPFTYLELRPRQNITFMNNGTVKWKQPKSYVQDLEKSIAADDEFVMCTINFPIMFLASTIDSFMPNISLLTPKIKNDILEIPKILDALAGEDTLMCRTPKEVIWGVMDPVLWRLRILLKEAAENLLSFIPQVVNKEMKKLAAFVATKLLGVLKEFPEGGVVSLQVNGSDDGYWATYTGTTDMQLINTLDLYNNSRYVPWWGSETCNMVNGTDGTQYHPDIQKSDMLFTFVTELCRSIYIIYNSTIELKGIELYRFTPPPQLFDNGTTFAFLKGFCEPHCWPSGTQDVSVCKGAPIMMSSPHFLYADPIYLDNVTGMHPNFDDHATFVDLEPISGVMLQGNKRLQLNVRVSNVTILPGAYALRECFLPLFYANEHGVISDADAAKLRNSLLVPLEIAGILKWCLVVLGTLVLAATVTYNVRRYLKENEPITVSRERSETDPLIN